MTCADTSATNTMIARGQDCVTSFDIKIIQFIVDFVSRLVPSITKLYFHSALSNKLQVENPPHSSANVAEGFDAQLIGPIQLHAKRQNSSICKFFQEIAWTFSFCDWQDLSFTYQKSEKTTYLDNLVFSAFSVL